MFSMQGSQFVLPVRFPVFPLFCSDPLLFRPSHWFFCGARKRRFLFRRGQCCDAPQTVPLFSPCALRVLCLVPSVCVHACPLCLPQYMRTHAHTLLYIMQRPAAPLFILVKHTLFIHAHARTHTPLFHTLPHHPVDVMSTQTYTSTPHE